MKRNYLWLCINYIVNVYISTNNVKRSRGAALLAVQGSTRPMGHCLDMSDLIQICNIHFEQPFYPDASVSKSCILCEEMWMPLSELIYLNKPTSLDQLLNSTIKC